MKKHRVTAVKGGVRMRSGEGYPKASGDGVSMSLNLVATVAYDRATVNSANRKLRAQEKYRGERNQQKRAKAVGVAVTVGVAPWWAAKILAPACGPLAPACVVVF